MQTITDLPGPGGLPFLGNVAHFDAHRFHAIMEAWSREFGTTYRFRLMRRSFVVTADHEAISTILRERPDTFSRTSRVRSILEGTGMRGVFSAEGEEWRRQRKLVMRAFTPDVVRNFFPTLQVLAERLRLRWERRLAAGKQVDLLRDLKAWTLDVTLWLAMGQDVNTLERETDPLQRDIESVFATMGRRLAAPFPYWDFISLPRDRATEAAFRRIEAAVTGFVHAARERVAAGAAPSNLLDALVAARDEPGSGFDDAHVIGNAMTMVFAGEDTTSNTAAWLLDFLSQSPRCAQAVAQEAQQVLGDAAVLPAFRQLDNFDYLDAAIREAMRLKPVAPVIRAQARIDTHIGDLAVPAGTVVMMLTRRSAELAGGFEDADTFRPERWSGTRGVNDPGRVLFPFGGGPRFCPGRYLAMAEIKVALSMLFRHFTLERVADAPPVEERFTFTVTPSALPVSLKRRSA